MDQTPTATCPPRPPDIDALHHLDLHTMTCPEPPNDSPYYTGWWDRAPHLDVQGIESSSQKPTEKAHDDAENQGPQHWKIWKDLKDLKRSEKIWKDLSDCLGIWEKPEILNMICSGMSRKYLNGELKVPGQ